MRQKQLDSIQEDLSPLERELGDVLKAVIVFGSTTRKDAVSSSDVDIAVILDDTQEEFDGGVYDQAHQKLQEIAEQSDFDLHVQDPQPLSQWWSLLISGEPWVVTAMADAQIVYDPAGYISATKQLLQEGELHGTNKRAQRLLERGSQRVSQAKKALLEDVTAELLRSMTEAAQAVLMYHGRPPPSPGQVGESLREHFVEEMELLSEEAINWFNGFYEFTQQVDHGSVTDITGRQLEHFLEDAQAFVVAMMDLFEELEDVKQESIISEAHEEVVSLCRQVLEEHGVDLPEEDGVVLDRFYEEFVETGIISESYWDLLRSIEDRKEKLDHGQLEEMSEEEIYSSRTNLREFESAIRRTMSRDYRPTFLQKVEFDNDEQAEVIEDKIDQVIEAYRAEIKAMWILTEEVENSRVITLIVLHNDIESTDHSRSEVRRAVEDLCNTLEHSLGADVDPSFYDLTDYWRLVRHGSPVTFSEIREGESIYDPAGFFLPLKRLLKTGQIPGTKEAMRTLIESAPRRVTKIKHQQMAHIAEKLYSAVVDAGQAALLVQGVAPPVQKNLPEELRIHLVDEGLMTERDAERAESVIDFWKDYEHGDIGEITGHDLEKLMQHTVEFLEEAEEILEEV